MSKLLIVESPSKIPTIQKCLGNDYIIMASCGHILDIEKNWKPTINDYEPKYIQTKKDVINKIKKASKNISKENIYLALDKDREGEMIAWSLQKELKIKNAKRIVFNSITKKEILNALKNPTVVNMDIFYAQQTRRLIDRAVGYTISPILMNNIENAISGGRVQSVIVKILVDKENEIEEYYKSKQSTFYYIQSNIKLNDFEIIFKLINKIDENEKSSDTSSLMKDKKLIFDKNDEKKVLKIIKKMAKSKFSLYDLTSRDKYQKPPDPFITSTLQQTASTYLNMRAKETMRIAQKLYEGGHITYMRTDSTLISEEGMENIKKEVIDKFGEMYYEKRICETKNENAQEAHECIRPTKISVNNLNLSNDENRLYHLIWKRTMQSQMKSAKYQYIKIEIEMLEQEKLKDYLLLGYIENLIFDGYLVLENKKPNKEIDLKKLNEKIIWTKIYATEDIKNQPSRYSEAQLIKKLEKLSIVRPSTSVSSLMTIFERNYAETKNIQGTIMNTNIFTIQSTDIETIETTMKGLTIGKENNKYVPTILGTKVTEFLNENFELFMDYKFTCKMEKNLDKISEGKKNKEEVLMIFLNYLKEKDEIFKIERKSFNKNIIGTIDDNEVNLIKGKNGHYISVNNKTLSVEELFKKQEPSNEKIIEYVKKNIPKSIGLINDKEVIMLKNQNGEYYVKLDDITLNIDKIIKENKNIKNEEIIEYIKKNKPLNIGKINDKQIYVKINIKGNKYAIVNDLYVDLTEFNENDDEKEILSYVKNFIKKNISLEWKIKKKNYKLKNGKFGYYLEEYENNNKIKNINISKILNEIKNKHNCSDIEAVKKMKKKDIEKIV